MATSKNTVRVRIEMHTRRKGGRWVKKDAFRAPNEKYFAEVVEQALQAETGWVRRVIKGERYDEILSLLEKRLQKAKGEDANYGAAKRFNCFKGMVSYKRQYPGSTSLKIVAVKE